MHTLYATLELQKDASTQDIKRAYHRLAHQYHPDKNPGDKNAEERFKEARRAYDVLSNAKRRRRYDLFGPAAVGLGSEAGYLGGEFAQNLAHNVGDLFQQIFARPQKPAADTRPQNAAAAALPLQIDLITAVVGGQASLALVRHGLCPRCQGGGHMPGSTPLACHVCNSTGFLRVKQGVFSIGKRCYDCAGQGQLNPQRCDVCRGEGFLKRDAVVSVRIPKGAQTGTLLRLRGEGAPAKEGHNHFKPTDQFVSLQVRPHPRFSQQDLDLWCDWPITIVEAALGASLQLPFIDGTPVTVRIPAGSQHGDTVRVKHQGATRLGGTQRGDFCVTLQLEVPRALSQTDRLHLEALRHLELATHYPQRAQAQTASSCGPSAMSSTAHRIPQS